VIRGPAVAALAALIGLGVAGGLWLGHPATAAGKPLNGTAPYFMPLDNSPQSIADVMAGSGE
jgi:hypothetical protein